MKRSWHIVIDGLEYQNFKKVNETDNGEEEDEADEGEGEYERDHLAPARLNNGAYFVEVLISIYLII